MNEYFRVANDDDLINNSLDNLKILRNLLEDLKKNNNKDDDLEILREFLNKKNIDSSINGEKFLYEASFYNNLNYFTEDEFKNKVNQVLGVNNIDMSGGTKSSINGFDAVYDYDFRITIQNSNLIKDYEIIEFLNVFKNKSNNLKYGIKVIPNEKDLIIIYLKKEYLYEAISILEEIRKELPFINKFGNTKAFTTGLSKNSYYGVSMGATKDGNSNSFINNEWAKRMKMGKTMTEYSGYLIDEAFNNLMNKHKDISNISAEELYVEMHNVHNKKYNFDIEEDVPLWINEEIHQIMK